MGQERRGVTGIWLDQERQKYEAEKARIEAELKKSGQTTLGNVSDFLFEGPEAPVRWGGELGDIIEGSLAPKDSPSLMESDTSRAAQRGLAAWAGNVPRVAGGFVSGALSKANLATTGAAMLGTGGPGSVPAFILGGLRTGRQIAQVQQAARRAAQVGNIAQAAHGAGQLYQGYQGSNVGQMGGGAAELFFGLRGARMHEPPVSNLPRTPPPPTSSPRGVVQTGPILGPNRYPGGTTTTGPPPGIVPEQIGPVTPRPVGGPQIAGPGGNVGPVQPPTNLGPVAAPGAVNPSAVRVREDQILKHLEGRSVKKTAKKFGITEEEVQDIARRRAAENAPKKKDRPAEKAPEKKAEAAPANISQSASKIAQYQRLGNAELQALVKQGDKEAGAVWAARQTKKAEKAAAPPAERKKMPPVAQPPRQPAGITQTPEETLEATRRNAAAQGIPGFAPEKPPTTPAPTPPTEVPGTKVETPVAPTPAPEPGSTVVSQGQRAVVIGDAGNGYTRVQFEGRERPSLVKTSEIGGDVKPGPQNPNMPSGIANDDPRDLGGGGTADDLSETQRAVDELDLIEDEPTGIVQAGPFRIERTADGYRIEVGNEYTIARTWDDAKEIINRRAAAGYEDTAEGYHAEYVRNDPSNVTTQPWLTGGDPGETIGLEGGRLGNVEPPAVNPKLLEVPPGMGTQEAWDGHMKYIMDTYQVGPGRARDILINAAQGKPMNLPMTRQVSGPATSISEDLGDTLRELEDLDLEAAGQSGRVSAGGHTFEQGQGGWMVRADRTGQEFGPFNSLDQARNSVVDTLHQIPDDPARTYGQLAAKQDFDLAPQEGETGARFTTKTEPTRPGGKYDQRPEIEGPRLGEVNDAGIQMPSEAPPTRMGPGGSSRGGGGSAPPAQRGYARQAFDLFNDARKTVALSGLAPVKSLAGNIGAHLFTGPAEALSRGEGLGAASRYYKELFNLPEHAREFRRGWNQPPNPSIGASGSTSSPLGKYNIFGRAMGAADEAAKASLGRAGLGSKEAGELLLTNPHPWSGHEALKTVPGEYLLPFRNVPFNQFTEGLSRPGKYPAVALGAYGAGYGAGKLTEDPKKLSVASAAMGPYALPFLAGVGTSGSAARAIQGISPIPEWAITESLTDPLGIFTDPPTKVWFGEDAREPRNKLFGGSGNRRRSNPLFGGGR